MCCVVCVRCVVLQARGNFVLLDPELNIKGTWGKEDTAYGYDFWYDVTGHNSVSNMSYDRCNSHVTGTLASACRPAMHASVIKKVLF